MFGDELMQNSERVLLSNVLRGNLESVLNEVSVDKWAAMLEDAIAHVARQSGAPVPFLSELSKRLEAAVGPVVAAAQELDEARDRAEEILEGLAREDQDAIQKVVIWL